MATLTEGKKVGASTHFRAILTRNGRRPPDPLGATRLETSRGHAARGMSRFGVLTYRATPKPDSGAWEPGACEAQA